MHVLVGCNIGNENNGTFRCTRDGSFFFSFFFFFPSLFGQKGSDAASDRARWICSEMIIIPVLRLLLLLFFFFFLPFACGCILRSLCCAIITDGCMLGPTKRNPNLIVFPEGI